MGGRFTISDRSHSLTSDDRGTALIIDGSQLHYSEPFKGYRISIVAFLHKATMDLASSQLEYLRSLGFRIPMSEALPKPCTDVTHGGQDWPCMSCGAYWSDSGAFRTPGYGGAWDKYGPIKALGFTSARGLTPGPSLMHVQGHPRYEGVLKVQFADFDEWFYDPPFYGELGKRHSGARRSRWWKDRTAEDEEAKEKRERAMRPSHWRCASRRLSPCKGCMAAHAP